MGKFLRVFLNILEIVMLLIAILILAFRDYFAGFYKLDIYDVLLILVGIIAAQTISNYISIRSIIMKMSARDSFLVVQDVSKAYNVLLEKGKYKECRIYAIASSLIQPQFYSKNNLYIEKCFLLIRLFDKSNESYDAAYENDVATVIRRWKMMVDEGKIKTLEVAFYNHYINSYCVIVDDEILMTDFVMFDDVNTSGQTTNHGPILYFDNSKDGKTVIIRAMKQFDNHFEYYKQSSESIKYHSADK